MKSVSGTLVPSPGLIPGGLVLLDIYFTLRMRQNKFPVQFWTRYLCVVFDDMLHQLINYN